MTVRLPIHRVSAHLQANATWIDENVGNRDGQLDAAEMDQFDRQHPGMRSTSDPLRTELAAAAQATLDLPADLSVSIHQLGASLQQLGQWVDQALGNRDGQLSSDEVAHFQEAFGNDATHAYSAKLLAQDLARIADTEGGAAPSISVPVGDLHIALQDAARWVDTHSGNQDGSLSSDELDRFHAQYGADARYAQTTALLREGLKTAYEGGVTVTSKDDLIRQVLRAGGSANEADLKAVATELQRLPAGALLELARKGFNVVVCRGSVTDHLTHLRGVQPRGWPPGATWDGVPGCCDVERKEVVVATQPGGPHGRHLPDTGNAHGSESLLIHETGHALDFGSGGTKCSAQDANFVAAYQADHANLHHFSSYLVQPGDAGREETFAETFAMFLRDPDEMQRRLPNLHAYWSRLQSTGFNFVAARGLP
ncbi:MAG: hypothetical protein AB2A00_19715 [Myxococcota bacterium]